MEIIHQIHCGSVNCFLIRNGHTAVLVDTGRLKYRNLILRACEDLQVRLILLTHGHVDHVQNAAFLSQELHAPIAMHRADVPLIGDNRRQKLYTKGFLGCLMLSATKHSFRKDKIEPFTPDILLSDQDSLSAYGIDARIIAVPGHTRGSIGVLIGERTLVVGDAMMNLLCLRPSLLYNNRMLMLRSVKKIMAHSPSMLYFGHGRPVRLHLQSPKEALEAGF